jgi:hypothetical protein
MNPFARLSPIGLVPSGFLVWSSCFVTLYALSAVGCEWGWAGVHVGLLTLHRAVLLAVWVLHLAVFPPLVLAVLGAPDDPWRRPALASTLAAFAATVWSGAPAAVLTSCI